MAEAQTSHQPVRGRVPLIHKLSCLRLHVPWDLDTTGAELPFDVLVHFSRREPHGAGEHLTNAAVAAVCRISKRPEIFLVVLHPLLTPEIPHHQIGADLVTNEVAGTEVGAHAALNAGASGLMPDGCHRECRPAEQIVVLGKDNDIASSLGDHSCLNGRLVLQDLAHHGSAQDQRIRADGRLCRRHTLGNGGAHGNVEHNGSLYLAHHGEELIGNVFTLQGVEDIEQGAHVVHYASHVQWEAPLRDRAARDLLDHGLLVACGIEGPHLKYLHLGAHAPDGIGKCGNLSPILSFQCDHRPFGPQMGGHGGHCGDDLVRIGAAQIFICLDERLALCGVDHKAFGLGVQLDVGGKPSAACADDTGCLDCFGQIHAFTALIPYLSPKCWSRSPGRPRYPPQWRQRGPPCPRPRSGPSFRRR